MDSPEFPLDLSVPSPRNHESERARPRSVFATVNSSLPLDLRNHDTTTAESRNSLSSDRVEAAYRYRSRSPPRRIPEIVSSTPRANTTSAESRNSPARGRSTTANGYRSRSPPRRFPEIISSSPRARTTTFNNRPGFQEQDAPASGLTGDFYCLSPIPWLVGQNDSSSQLPEYGTPRGSASASPQLAEEEPSISRVGTAMMNYRPPQIRFPEVLSKGSAAAATAGSEANEYYSGLLEDGLPVTTTNYRHSRLPEDEPSTSRAGATTTYYRPSQTRFPEVLPRSNAAVTTEVVPVSAHHYFQMSPTIPPDSNSLDKQHAAPVKGATYSKETLELVLDKVQSGEISIYRASKEYGIPRGTIQFRLGAKCKHQERSGPPTVLTAEEEQALVTWLFSMQQKGFPVTAAGLQEKVSMFIKASPRPNPFKDGVPGKNWLTGFLKRHPDVVVRTPEGVSAASSCVSESDLRSWFTNVLTYSIAERLMEALKDPTRKVNGDEIGFYLFQLAKKVLAKKGSRDVMMVEAGDPKKNITVLFCFSADGFYFPPDVILAYERMPPEVTQSFPGSWGLGKSKSGWMDTKNFVLYIQKILHPTLVRRNVTFPVLFFVDGHRSHTAFAAAEACLKLGIVLIALYPNSTRMLQPADVGIFGPLKLSWRKVLAQMPPNEKVTATSFADKLLSAMNAAFKPETIKAAFKACGIHPFDPDAPNYQKCLAKSTHPQSDPPQPTSLQPCSTNEAPIQAPALIDSSSMSVSTPVDSEELHNVVLIDETIRTPAQSTDESSPALVDPAIVYVSDDRFNDITSDEAIGAQAMLTDRLELELLDTAVLSFSEDELARAPVQSTDGSAPALDSAVCNDLDHTNRTLVAAPTLPLQDRTNTKPISITDFLTTPPTPKRKGKHINFKIRTNPILTAAERMQELQEIQREKEQAQQKKLENARKREQNRAAKEADKIQRDEARARKKAERQEWLALQETLKLRKQEEKRAKKEAKQKAKQSPDEVFVNLR